MSAYFSMQCKRFLRFLPGAFLVALVLLGSLLTVYGTMLRQNEVEENQKVQIGLVGTADENLLQMGLAALKSLDSTRTSMELVELTEPEAKAALSRGEIAAYVVIPEEFMDNALSGTIIPLDFVSTTGAAGMVSIFKDEITDLVADLLLSSQKGTFGMADLLEDHGITKGLGKKMDKLALQYVDYVLLRNQTYRLEELGIADDLGLAQYLLCGICVLLMSLVCLPFAPVLIRQDMALTRMLAARGRSAFGQFLMDFLAYLLCMLTMLALLAVALSFLPGTDSFLSWDLMMGAVSVCIMSAALSFFLCNLTGHLIGGVLMQFFITVALGFVSGCMYPPYFFPAGVQKLSGYLPMGIARSRLACSLTGNDGTPYTLLLLGFSLAFVLLAWLFRARRIQEAHG